MVYITAVVTIFYMTSEQYNVWLFVKKLPFFSNNECFYARR